MALCLSCWTLDRAVQFWALAGAVIVGCVLGQDTLLLQCLSLRPVE